MYPMIETHCHLDYLKAQPIDEIINSAKKTGVEKIITIAVEPNNFDAVQKLAHSHQSVYFTQGIHPHDAKLSTEHAMKTIRERCQDKKMVAVGEIGLDYHYNHSPKEIQRQVFKQQLEIAIQEDKPVVIHSREADEDMIEILEQFAPQLKRKGVIHSFSSEEKLAQKALELEFYLGFNGIITFKKAQNVRDIVNICPLDKIVIETDSPFLTPIPFRGKENAPDKLPYILEKISEIKQIGPEEVAKYCYQNSLKLFSFN